MLEATPPLPRRVTASVPRVIVVAPVYMFGAMSTAVPSPVLSMPAAPRITPAKVLESPLPKAMRRASLSSDVRPENVTPFARRSAPSAPAFSSTPAPARLMALATCAPLAPVML